MPATCVAFRGQSMADVAGREQLSPRASPPYPGIGIPADPVALRFNSMICGPGCALIYPAACSASLGERQSPPNGVGAVESF